jgi:Domain of unknown function (DUF4190)
MSPHERGELPTANAQGGGWGPPGGGYPPGGYGPPGGPGGFAPAPPGDFGGGKPITGGKQTMALHAMTIDPTTGLPRGEKPPASTASVIALICGLLLCLGPLTGIPAIIAGFIGRGAAKKDPANVGGAGMALAGIILGALNLVGWVAYFFIAVVLVMLS